MTNRHHDRLARVYATIHADPGVEHSLDALADVAAFSRFHFHRVFHAVTGETVAEAVRRVRLHRASVDLVHGDTPVAQIGQRYGYRDAAAFSRAFKVAYGKSPAVFRSDGQEIAERADPLGLKGDPDLFDVTIENFPARRFIGIEHSGPYATIGATFDKLWSAVAMLELMPHIRGTGAVYLDDPSSVAPESLRSVAGIFVDESVPLPEGFREVAHDGGRHAVLHFKGPYSGLEAAYVWLYGTWLAGSGESPADGPCWEIYDNNPMDTAPNDLETRVLLPLRPAS